jgi:Transposase DDE domain
LRKGFLISWEAARMVTGEGGATIDLDEAVRMFQKLVPPEEFNAREGVTRAMVYTPWIVTWLMIYQRLNGAAALTDGVTELAGMDDDLVPKNKRTREKTVSANTGAYARARGRLKVEAAENAADQVSDALMTQGTSASATATATAGRRVFLVDGSTLALASVDSLREVYPPPKNQHGPSHRPAIRLVAAHDLATGTAVRPEIGQMNGPKAIGEVEMAGPLLNRLPKNSVIIGDRNFGIFFLAWLASQARHDFLVRLTNVRFKALVRQAKLVGPGVWQLSWTPSPWDRKHNPGLPADAALAVRLHEVRVSETLTLWLVTSLDATGTALAATYHGRQHVETDLRDLKQTLRLEVLRSRSPEMIRKELAAATIAYNLVIQVRKLAAAQAQVEPRRLSFARVHSLVRILLHQRLSALEPAEAQERIDQVLRMAAQCKIPHRPGRSYPRETFGKPTKYARRRLNNDAKHEK